MTQIDFWIREMEVAKLTYEALQVQYLTQLIHNSVPIFNVTMQGWAAFKGSSQFLQGGNNESKAGSRFQDIFWQANFNKDFFSLRPQLYLCPDCGSGLPWILIVQFQKETFALDYWISLFSYQAVWMSFLSISMCVYWIKHF